MFVCLCVSGEWLSRPGGTIAFVAAIGALEEAVADAGLGQALAEGATMALAARRRRRDVRACRHALYPVHVVVHLRVDSRPAWPAAPIAIRRYACN